MYNLNMLDYAEMYRNDRLREASQARMATEVPGVRPPNLQLILGKILTGVGTLLTALGTYLISNRSA